MALFACWIAPFRPSSTFLATDVSGSLRVFCGAAAAEDGSWEAIWDGEPAGYLAGLVATHTIGDDKEAAIALFGDKGVGFVLVLFPLLPHVSFICGSEF